MCIFKLCSVFTPHWTIRHGRGQNGAGARTNGGPRHHHRGPMGGGVVVTGRSPQLCAGRARTQAAAARPSEARVDGAITELCFTTNASCKHFSHPWFSINYLQNIYKPLQFLDFWGQSVSLRSDIWCIDKRSLWVWFSRRGLEGGSGIINYISLNCSIVSNWKYLKSKMFSLSRLVCLVWG